ncbi:unnamed protein product [Paramecium sonneborni]|uniref:Uncharacterized protein n=1 Tax=Paramecium sonneborni TaxID=65129 RepID=A0A8S1L1W4_9CILI|nr:unnamed protein product [Paramecium sonneborni]
MGVCSAKRQNKNSQLLQTTQLYQTNQLNQTTQLYQTDIQQTYKVQDYEISQEQLALFKDDVYVQNINKTFDKINQLFDQMTSQFDSLSKYFLSGSEEQTKK